MIIKFKDIAGIIAGVPTSEQELESHKNNSPSLPSDPIKLEEDMVVPIAYPVAAPKRKTVPENACNYKK